MRTLVRVSDRTVRVEVSREESCVAVALSDSRRAWLDWWVDTFFFWIVLLVLPCRYQCEGFLLKERTLIHSCC